MIEFKLTLDNLLTFIGLAFVAWQIYESNHQRKLESQIRMHDINRELIAMGFSKPELFEILKDTDKAAPELERWYLQLWLNQLSMFYSLKTAGIMQKDYQESVQRDFHDMFQKSNMRRHWQAFGKYYPASFRKAVNAILDEAGHEAAAEAAKRPKS